MNLNFLVEHALAQTLLHSLWQIAVLGLFAAMLLGILRRKSAALKHAIGMLFLMMMAVAPVMTFSLLMSEQGNVTTAAHTAGVLPLLMPSMLNMPQVSESTSALLLPWFWCAGVLFMLVRLIGGWWMLRKLDHQQSSPLPDSWQQRAEPIRVALGIQSPGKHQARRENRRAIYRARLAADCLDAGVDPDADDAGTNRSLIAHELAHIRRLDWVWNGLQCVIEAVLFYHPAVWWLNRRIRQERENACDDLAVAVCGDAIVLAEALAGLERVRMPGHMLALSADGGSLMQRITRLLSPDTPVRIRWGVPIGLTALLCSGVLLAAQATNSAKEGSIAETASWWSSVGNSTEIHDDSDGVHRVYRKWTDLSGNSHESFTVNGKSTPIDRNMRQWLKEQETRAANIPPPPLPPLPPLPAAPPEPPEPPELPEITVENNAPLRAAVIAIRQDATATNMLGNSIVMESIGGPSNISDDEVSLSLVMSGSKGRADVHIVGEKQSGQWRYSTLDVSPRESSAK